MTVFFILAHMVDKFKWVYRYSIELVITWEENYNNTTRCYLEGVSVSLSTIIRRD